MFASETTRLPRPGSLTAQLAARIGPPHDRNVLAPGGLAGLPVELPDLLIEAGVTRVLLAQARTPAGEAAAALRSA